MVATVCYVLSVVMMLLAVFGLKAILGEVPTVTLGLMFVAGGLLFEKLGR